MSDFITERDPIVFNNPVPNLHGKSPAYVAAQRYVDKVYKEYLDYIDTCEETGNFDHEKVREKFKECLKAEQIKDDIYEKMVSKNLS